MGIVVDENETKSRNFIARALVYHWTVKPIVKSPEREEREKYLFLYWKGVPFNRWMLFTSSFLIQFCCGSLYSWSVFNAPIDILIYGTKTANKAPNTFYIAVGMFGTTAMLMGPWLERHGPRRGLLLGSIIFGIGQGIASLSLHKKSIAGVYIGYGILGGFGLGLNYISPVSALQKFFPDYRGVASGFAVAGFGAGSIVWSKVYIPLLEQYELSETFAIMGATLTGAMLVASIFMRTPPNDFTAGGLNVMGEKVESKEESHHHASAAPASAPLVMTLIQSIFSPDFFFMYLMFFANQLFGLVALSRLATMTQDLFDQTASEGANVVSINGVFNCLGRLVLPMLADLAIRLLNTNPPFARKLVFVFTLCVQMVIVAVLPTIIDTKNYAGFRAVMWILTFTYGGGFGTIPCFLTDMFGPYNIGALHGMILTAWSIGGVGGGLGFTHIFDEHKPAAGVAATVPGAFDKAYEANFRWILGVLIGGLVMIFFVRTSFQDRTAPGWRYSIFEKKVVHFKSGGKDLHAKVGDDEPKVVENL
jgi:MFS family permease